MAFFQAGQIGLISIALSTNQAGTPKFSAASLSRFEFELVGEPTTITDCVGADIFGRDLHDAWLLAVRGGENRTEVQIVCKHNVVVCAGVSHDFRVRCI